MMKRQWPLIAVLGLLSGCGGGPGAPSGAGIPVLDVEKTDYPEMQLRLDAIADVRYVPLETREGFWVENADMGALGGGWFVTANVQTGDVLLFDAETGGAVRKFNHKGGSGQEYGWIASLTLDAQRGEVFLQDSGKDRIQVYDLEGRYLRTLPLPHGYWSQVVGMDDVLVGYNGQFRFGAMDGTFSPEPDVAPVTVISKTDGAVVREVRLPYERVLLDYTYENVDGGMRMVSMGTRPLTAGDGSVIISEPSCDTIYRLTRELELVPLLARSVSVHRGGVPVFFNVGADAGDRLFLMRYKQPEFDMHPGLHNLVLDRADGRMYHYGTVENPDGWNPWFTPTQRASSGELYWTRSALMLTEMREDGTLGGALEKLVAGLKEDDNSVLMIVNFRKGVPGAAPQGDSHRLRCPFPRVPFAAQRFRISGSRWSIAVRGGLKICGADVVCCGCLPERVCGRG